MNAEARAFAIALDRAVTREIRYREIHAQATRPRTEAAFERREAANDPAINDASLPRAGHADTIRKVLANDPASAEGYRLAVRVNAIVLASIVAMLVLAALIA